MSKKQNQNLFKINFLLVLLFSISTVSCQETTFFNSSIDSSFTADKKVKYLDSLISLYETKKIDSLAFIYNDYAYFLYEIGELDKAISYNKKAVYLANKKFPDNLKLLQLSTSDLGFYYRKEDDYKNSIYYYEEAIKYNDTTNIANMAYYDLGLIYINLQDHYNAIKNLEIAINRLQGLSYNKSILRSSYLNLSYVQFQLKTTESLKKGIALALKADSLTSHVRTSRAKQFKIKMNLASLNSEQQLLNVYLASKYYNEALVFANDNILKAEVYSGLADLYNIIDTEKSLFYYHKAIELVDNDDTIFLSDLYNGLGHALSISGDFKKSLEYRHLAMNLLTKNSFKEPEKISLKFLQKVESKEYLLHYLPQLAETYLNYYEQVNNESKLIEKSIDFFKMADFLVDDLKRESISFKSKLFWRRISTNIYSKAIKACFLKGDVSQAFFFMEKNNALLLLEDVIKANQNKQLNKYTNFYKDSALSKNKTLSKISYNPKIASLQQIKENIVSNELVVNYHITEDDGYGITVEKNTGYAIFIFSDQTYFVKLKNVENLYKNLEEVWSSIRKPFNTKEDITKFRKNSFSLYKKLFPKKEIREKIKNKKITLIPDGNLAFFPFECLSTSDTHLNYLIQDCEISYSQSNSFLALLKQNVVQQNKILGVAPIKFDYLNKNDLIYSNDEVALLKKKYGGLSLVKEEASVVNFIKNAKDAAIIHLATHANASNDEAPWIAFSDKKIGLEEIYKIENTAELVVLSGCNTGIGENKSGEGVMNLARGFFYTGSKSVISSLWQLNDKSTATIIEEFYTKLSLGKNKREALRSAKLSYLKNAVLADASPYYWANMVLWGNPKTLSVAPQKNSSLLWYLILSLLLIGFGFYFLKKKFNNSTIQLIISLLSISIG